MSEQVLDAPVTSTITDFAFAKSIEWPDPENIKGATADIVVDGDTVRVGWHESSGVSGAINTFNEVQVEASKVLDASKPIMVLSGLSLGRVMSLEEDVQGVFVQSSTHAFLEWSRGPVGAHKTLYDAVGLEYESLFELPLGASQCKFGGTLDWPEGRSGKPRLVVLLEGDVAHIVKDSSEGELGKVIESTRQDVWSEFKDAMPNGPDDLLVVTFVRPQKGQGWKVIKK